MDQTHATDYELDVPTTVLQTEPMGIEVIIDPDVLCQHTP